MKTYPWLAQPWSSFKDRLDSGRMAHAMLIHGPDGTGKFELAKLMAARLLCTNDTDFACGACRSCTLFESGAHPDWFLLQPEEGKHQILIEQVRSTITALTLTASFSPRKVALIYPAEAMNSNAANALLKSLEEPPGETVLLLVAHDASRLPVTIRSRCQSIAIPLPHRSEAHKWLHEDFGLDPGIALSALNAAGGSPLDARHFAQTGQVEVHQSLLNKLSGLLNQPGIVSRVASELSEIEANTLWNWLSYCSADALRVILTGQCQGWLNNFSKLNSKSLAILQQRADRNRMLSRTPVRQDLLLHEWLIKWSQQAGTP